MKNINERTICWEKCERLAAGNPPLWVIYKDGNVGMSDGNKYTASLSEMTVQL
jgi:hypothetical protein